MDNLKANDRIKLQLFSEFLLVIDSALKEELTHWNSALYLFSP